MLTEKRHEYILQELKRKGSITVNEIKEELGISESTIRRDLNSLDEEGRLVKVFGAKEFAKLIYSAKKIYDENRADLEKDRDDEEFMAMYEQYEAFSEFFYS